jgi:hypothetical protein
MRILIGLVATGAIALALTTTWAQDRQVVGMDSANAAYHEARPGVSKASVWGDDTKGPYGSFTKFAPGVKNPLHTHTNDIRIVVLKGAYIYEPEHGEKRRVVPGQYLFVPGGNRHFSSGDTTDGALFYEESQGKFDFVTAEPRNIDVGDDTE